MVKKKGISKKNMRNDGVSEIIGTVVLLAVAVASFSVLYVTLSATLVTEESPQVNVIGYIEGNNIVLEHQGGDTLKDNTKIDFVIGGRSQSFTLTSSNDNFTFYDGNNNGEWDVGEKITFYSSESFSGLAVDTSVVDTAGNTALFIGSLQEGDSTSSMILATSVDEINPYEISTSPLSISATSTGDNPGNVSLYYRWSSSNFTTLGTGNDGAITISTANTVVNDYAYLIENENSGDSTITVNDTTGFNSNDEILIIQIQNASGGTAGGYEFATISSINGNDITINSALTTNFYSGTFNQASSTVTQIVKIPHYTTVQINTGASITAPAWDGYTGGIVIFRATGAVIVNGQINTSEKGFRGGFFGVSNNCDGAQGESWNGKDTSGSCYSYGAKRYANNGGGGSYICGGGGEYGGGATNSDPWTGSGSTYARKGETYGTPNLERIYFGSGGGGQWDGNDPGISDGGDGGGIIILYANTVNAGTGSIVSKGQTTNGVQYGSYSYGSSGGAGGSIYLIANDINGASNFITAEGGLGNDAPLREGGDGGVGRIRLDYGTLSGTTTPTAGYTGSAPDETSGGWVEWSHPSNPDTNTPWEWNFNFPNGTGYYQFYSIGKYNGNTEDTPSTADAICQYTSSQYTWVQSSQADFEAGISINTDTTNNPGDVIITQGEGYVYAFRGDDKDDFWRYNSTSNTWTSMDDVPNDVDEGGALTNDGTFIYGLQGNDEKDFWRYNSTSNTWTSMADVPEKIKEGGSLTYVNNYIYALRGDDKKNFNRYNISSDSWSAMANTPEKVKWGGALISDGDRYIYAFRGNDEKDFWRYDIISNSWTSMADTPEKVLEGGSLTFDGTYIYGFRGDDEKDFWRYNITANTWTTLADTPDDVKEGGSLTYDGNNYIYALRGDDKEEFWRYNSTSNTWSSMADTSNDVKSGGALTCIDSGGYLSSGSLTSSIKDCTFVAIITQVSWDATINGQTITMQIRSDDAADMSDPSSWETVTNGDTSISTPANRYIQYKVTLSTTNTSMTPMLHDVTITYEEE